MTSTETKTETRWTPGPWLIEFCDEEGGFIIWMKDNHAVYEPQHRVHVAPNLPHSYEDEEPHPSEDEQYAEAQANAHLIAAAPLLYAALEEALAWTLDAHRPRGPLQNALRAALAAAKGETP